MDALAAAGVKVGLNPTEAGELMADIVKTLYVLTRPQKRRASRDDGCSDTHSRDLLGRGDGPPRSV